MNVVQNLILPKPLKKVACRSAVQRFDKLQSLYVELMEVFLMKKIPIIQIITGLLLLGIGLGFPALRQTTETELTYVLILMSESLWLTSALFGGALLIGGIINKSLGEKKTEYATLKTEIYSHLISACIGIGVYCFSMWQIIVSLELDTVNSREKTLSMILTFVCILAVFLLGGFYFKERKDNQKSKGKLFDIITLIIYFLPFFFLCDTVYEMLIKY